MELHSISMHHYLWIHLFTGDIVNVPKPATKTLQTTAPVENTTKKPFQPVTTQDKGYTIQPADNDTETDDNKAINKSSEAKEGMNIAVIVIIVCIVLLLCILGVSYESPARTDIINICVADPLEPFGITQIPYYWSLYIGTELDS